MKNNTIFQISNLITIKNSRFFDKEWYLREYPDISSTQDPYLHYLTIGWKEGRLPSAIFDQNRYLSIYSINECPLLHYERHGYTGFFPAPRYMDICLRMHAGIDLTISEKVLYLVQTYKNTTGKTLNIIHSSPLTYSEKINWLMLNYFDDRMTILADKYRSKLYLKELLGQDYSIPLINVYNNANEIDFSALPNSFVLKTNWGAGNNYIVKNKQSADLHKIISDFNKWMLPSGNNYFHFLEPSYKNISPKIICEEYKEDKNGNLYDFKVTCFNGVPKLIHLHLCNIGTSTFFDTDGNFLPITLNLKKNSPNNISPNISLPPFYKKLLFISKKIAAPFPLVRVDFFFTETEYYLGEITFFQNAGCFYLNEDWDLKLGSWLKLPEPNTPQTFNVSEHTNSKLQS